MTEEEKRLHRACFAGHRIEKLKATEAEIRAWLNQQIQNAIDTQDIQNFITGMGMGVDLWAAQTVLEKREQYGLHLIAVSPWPGFPRRWNATWQAVYDDVWKRADLKRVISEKYANDVFAKRNDWMVDHAHLVIAYYSGEKGGTQELLDHAADQGLILCVHTEHHEAGEE